MWVKIPLYAGKTGIKNTPIDGKIGVKIPLYARYADS
jgi:hypothetical protein